VLEVRELYDRFTLDLSTYRRRENIPNARKKRCPVTQCVPARLDRRYFNEVKTTICGASADAEPLRLSDEQYKLVSHQLLPTPQAQ